MIDTLVTYMILIFNKIMDNKYILKSNTDNINYRHIIT